MAVTLLSPGGIEDQLSPGIKGWLLALSPQTATVPLARSARLCSPPAATATTLLRPGGTFVSPKSLQPQATTVPSAFSARLWFSPAATATTLVSLAGTFVCPQ